MICASNYCVKTARKSKGNVQKSAGKMHENVMVGIVRHVMARTHSAQRRHDGGSCDSFEVKLANGASFDHINTFLGQNRHHLQVSPWALLFVGGTLAFGGRLFHHENEAIVFRSPICCV